MLSNSSGIDVTTPAVVLKFDPNVMHHGGLGAIRSLGRLGVPVFGVHEGPWAPAANSRYLQGRVFWTPNPEHSQRVQSGLMQLAQRIGRPSVLITTDDAGAIFLAEHGDSLRESFLFPAPQADLPRRLAGKYSMHQLCRERGVPSPQATVPASLEEARDFANRAGFPVIAKLTTPWQHGHGQAPHGQAPHGQAPHGQAPHGQAPHGQAPHGQAPHGQALRSTSIIHTAAALDEAYRAFERQNAGLMLQEHIPGGPGQDWFFHGYCGADSACRPAFTGVKDRSYPAHAGLTSLGHSARNIPLRDQVTSLLSELSYRGITDLDLRLDRRDGQYKLLDFNPRLGAQFRLFTDSAGVDVIRAAYLDLTGQAIAENEVVDGRRFLVENYDPIGALGYWRSGELGLKSWLTSLRGVDEAAWFARDDLRPFGLMCLRMSWRMASRPLHRGGAGAGPDKQPRYRAGRAARRGAGPGNTQSVTASLAAQKREPELHTVREKI
jgi:predicted ATP-grasp superfamily ATP-dependent carboligase